MEFTLFAQIHLKLEAKFGDPLLQVNTAEKYHLQKRQIASSQRKMFFSACAPYNELLKTLNVSKIKNLSKTALYLSALLLMLPLE